MDDESAAPESVAATARRWFGTVDLGDTPTSPALANVLRVVQLLDQLQPTAIDPVRSSIRPEDWPDLGKTLTLELVHSEDEDGVITVLLGDGQAVVSWYGDHEHLPRDVPVGDDMVDDLLDTIGSVLRGRYEVEEDYFLGAPYRSRVIDRESRPPRVVSSRHSLLSLFGWCLPTTTTRSKRITYGVQNRRPGHPF